LKREGLVRIGASPGTVFDPNEHEAVLTIPTAAVPEGSVVEALQVGYRFGDRLLRPARVTVARAIEPPPERPDPDAG
jgi:molecular chaperone GrpE